ncbi:MAG: hypothetical protein C0473_00505 [Cyanobacteria bacterium DS3.002]|nr:hypothetical protein [Cyanobacteria bacterium DS3.002]MBA4076036.1 hypothetical protein [Cyanobacteria bacterium PR.023]
MAQRADFVGQQSVKSGCQVGPSMVGIVSITQALHLPQAQQIGAGRDQRQLELRPVLPDLKIIP